VLGIWNLVWNLVLGIWCLNQVGYLSFRAVLLQIHISTYTGESFNLNPTGQILFGLIREGKDYGEIRNYFLKHYDAEETIFEKDFEDFMHMMTSYQMLETDEQA
jgi:hypothetical protein